MHVGLQKPKRHLDNLIQYTAAETKMESFLITCIRLAVIGLPIIMMAGIYEWFVAKTRIGRAFERWLFKVLDIDVDDLNNDK